MHAWHLEQLLNLLLTTFYLKLSRLYVWVSCVTTLVLALMAIFHNFTLTNMSGSSLGQGNEVKDSSLLRSWIHAWAHKLVLRIIKLTSTILFLYIVVVIKGLI